MRGREIIAMDMDDQPWSLYIYQRGIIEVIEVIECNVNGVRDNDATRLTCWSRC